MSSEIITDQDHVSALHACASAADRIRYACEQVVRPTTREVREWLSAHGVDSSRSYASSVVSAWRQARGLGDTGDLVALTPEMLAELDRVVTAEDPHHPRSTTENTSPDVGGVTHTVTDIADNTTDTTNTVHNSVRDGVQDSVRDRTDNSQDSTNIGVGNGLAPALTPATPAPSPVGRIPALLRWVAGMAWVAVLGAALGISWWSLLEYARGFGIPTPLAAVVSLVFDAAALIVASLAHQYAVSPYSGIGPRLALLGLLAGSIYLNWQHAVSKGFGTGAAIIFAAPAAVGIVLFELHTGWHSRLERHTRGRIARPLPVLGLWGWLLHPMQSAVTMWTVSHARGRAVRRAELARIEHQQTPS